MILTVQRLLTLLLLIVVGGLAIWYFEDVWEILSGVDLGWFLAGALFHLANYSFRAYRFKILTNGKLKLWPTGFNTVITHGALAYLMPMRTGDLALPALLKKACGSQWGEGFHVLLWARVLDLGALGFCILAAVAFLPVEISEQFLALWVVSGVVLACAPLLFNLASKMHGLNPKWLFGQLRQLSAMGKLKASALASSMGIWIMVGGLFYCVSRAVGLPLAVGDAWFLVTIQLPLQIIPLQGAGNAGNHETGWVLALGILGYPTTEAIGFAISTHALILTYVVGLWGGGLLMSLLTKGLNPAGSDKARPSA